MWFITFADGGADPDLVLLTEVSLLGARWVAFANMTLKPDRETPLGNHD